MNSRRFTSNFSCVSKRRVALRGDFEGAFVGCGSIATELIRRNELTLYRSSTLIRGAVRCRKSRLVVTGGRQGCRGAMECHHRGGGRRRGRQIPRLYRASGLLPASVLPVSLSPPQAAAKGLDSGTNLRGYDF